MGLKNEPSVTQIAIDVACAVAMATLDEPELGARARVLEAVCSHPRRGREMRSKRRGNHSEETE